MTDMLNLKIPCDLYARLAPIAMQPRYEANGWFQSLRYENGVLIACNRAVMAIARMNGPIGWAHIVADAALLKQCQLEGPAQSMLSITITPALGWGTAKTTMGYQYPGNVVATAQGENKLADWRSIVPSAPSSRYKGPMFFDGAMVSLLAASSPSGRIVFEEKPDIDKPIIVRDAYDDDWTGFFIARMFADAGNGGDPATVPGWLKEVCK